MNSNSASLPQKRQKTSMPHFTNKDVRISFRQVVLALLIASSILACRPERSHWIVDSEAGKLKVEVVADSINVPFGMVFISDDQMLVTNRSKGQLLLLNCNT